MLPADDPEKNPRKIAESCRNHLTLLTALMAALHGPFRRLRLSGEHLTPAGSTARCYAPSEASPTPVRDRTDHGSFNPLVYLRHDQRDQISLRRTPLHRLHAPRPSAAGADQDARPPRAGAAAQRPRPPARDRRPAPLPQPRLLQPVRLHRARVALHGGRRVAAYQGHAPVPRDPRRARAAAGRLAEPEQRGPVAELLRALGAQRRRPLAAGSAGAGPGAAGSGAAGTSAAPGAGSASAAAPGKAAGAPMPVLDAHARQELVERAMGKSTRQVQQMLAEVDPEAAAPAERLRPLGDGRWELKAVVDAECQRGLQQLRELLSHVDPHLTVGQLVGRLVREGVERYDPSRPPRRKRRKSDPASDGCSAETAGGETADRVAAAAGNPRRAEKSAAPTTCPAAPKRSAKATAVGTSPAVLPASGGSGEASPKRGLGPPPGSRTSAPKCVAPRAERAGSAGDAAATEPTSAPKARVAAGSSIAVPSSHGAGSAEQTSAARLGVAGGAGSAAPTVAAKSGKSSGRSIPAAVRREVWRRDQGCCSYVDRHTGRRCGSRFFLEIDHIVPVARGGGAEPANLRLSCAAHHRYRHARRQRSAPRDSVT